MKRPTYPHADGWAGFGNWACLTVHGIPVPQPRTKARNMGKHAGVYTPGTANEWKALIAAKAEPHVDDLGMIPPEKPVAVSVTLRLPRPQQYRRKRDNDGPIWAQYDRGDVDNYAKAILDILTQIGMWADDRQVVSLMIDKTLVAKDGGRVGADITIMVQEGE